MFLEGLCSCRFCGLNLVAFAFVCSLTHCVYYFMHPSICHSRIFSSVIPFNSVPLCSTIVSFDSSIHSLSHIESAGHSVSQVKSSPAQPSPVESNRVKSVSRSFVRSFFWLVFHSAGETSRRHVCWVTNMQWCIQSSIHVGEPLFLLALRSLYWSYCLLFETSARHEHYLKQSEKPEPMT